MSGTVPSAADARRCALPRGASVVRTTSETLVTVEKHATGGDLLEGGSESRVWRGCSERRGLQLELERGGGDFGGGRYLRSVRLAGPVVGYLVEDGNRYETDTRVTVVGLDSGERWSSEPENRQNGSLTSITELAVNRLGDVAWIREGYGTKGRRAWRIFVRRAGIVSLRYEARRELSRLRLGSLRLRWTENAERHKRSL